MKIRLTEEMWKESSMYVSYCPEAIRPVVIPKCKEVPALVIKNNMRIIGMSREKYFELLQKV